MWWRCVRDALARAGGISVHCGRVVLRSHSMLSRRVGRPTLEWSYVAQRVSSSRGSKLTMFGLAHCTHPENPTTRSTDDNTFMLPLCGIYNVLSEL